MVTRPDAAVFLPPLQSTGPLWTTRAIVGWWDLTAMLTFGGIPWNCYFQRVLSCRSPRDAQAHSVLSGLLTIALTFPPLILGLVAAAYPWPPDLAARLSAQPADALPMVFKHVTPPIVGLLGLAAIVAVLAMAIAGAASGRSSPPGHRSPPGRTRPDQPLPHRSSWSSRTTRDAKSGGDGGRGYHRERDRPGC